MGPVWGKGWSLWMGPGSGGVNCTVPRTFQGGQVTKPGEQQPRKQRRQVKGGCGRPSSHFLSSASYNMSVLSTVSRPLSGKLRASHTSTPTHTGAVC